MRIIFGCLTTVCLFLALSAWSAANAKIEDREVIKSSPFVALSNDELLAEFKQELTSKEPQYCGRFVPITQEMLKRGNFSGPVKAQHDRAAFHCALDQRQWKKAYAAMSLAENGLKITYGEFGYRIAFLAEEYPEAVARLEEIANADDDKEFLEIDSDIFWDVSRKLNKKENKGLRKRAIMAMANSPHYSKLESDFRAGLAGNILDYQAESGKFTNAGQWVAELKEPYRFTAKLADKKYQQIWAIFEKAIGPNFERVNNRYLEHTKKNFDSAPSDLKAYGLAAHALLYAGRFEELTAFVKTPAEKEFAVIAEDEAWALNVKAYALDALGQTDEAAFIFDRIASIPITDDNKYWLINFTINRASRLVGQEKWQEGYDAAIFAEKFPGSPFAEMLIRHAKACALFNLGKTNDATRLFDEIYENREDGYATAAEAMLCGGQKTKAAEIIIEAFGDDRSREDMLKQLQKPQFEFFYTKSNLPSLHGLLNADAKLRAAFEKEGRLIPDEFMPVAGIKRQSQ